MKGSRFRAALVVVPAVAFVVVLVVASCSTLDHMVVPPPLIPGAKFVGMETCAPCHEKMVKDFKLTSHARVTIPGEADRVEGQGCESCHGAGSRHVEESDPDKNGGFIINPGKKPEGCYQCHLDKQAEFNLPYHHPLREGRMTCHDCHDPHGEDIKIRKSIFGGRGLSVGRTNETCGRCHMEQFRPHVFEHEALREGCIICHSVHGSINPKLLVERDANLCLKCHAQRPTPGPARTIYIGSANHTAFLAQGPCFSAGCHTAIHGSNINHWLRY